MPLKIAIFEDDLELAELMKEILEHYRFEVSCHFSLAKDAWKSADVVLGDFRNKIVSFQELCENCQDAGIPVIAVSGSETGHSPQVLKPFRIETLKKTILQALIENRGNLSQVSSTGR